VKQLLLLLEGPLGGWALDSRERKFYVLTDAKKRDPRAVVFNHRLLRKRVPKVHRDEVTPVESNLFHDYTS